MGYRLNFTSSAAREVKKLPGPARDRVLIAIEDLAEDPRPHGAKRLVSTDAAWRIRVGDYRVIYEVVDEVLTVTVIRAGHRREVYDR
ncbi:mRNA interferase RelE/StbE [Quadrisphaera granulorum]|uniref:mRNA interferase RelE/StbE n=1 Tax=Quadrisphaera granulorum TaxID=317664 RepID=A0A315ZYI9_9ACTN|nr:type II toxin-antitoxin system RelE/ParE family toxin [Quadrisphaera granulorum]PWJ49584.1 mRNA interferase RelE/StbE [Quadrisphaera granulorum]SZE98163.1 mRNA interferase RelE/StbE [Quadrisphaera granulorum]